jgi:hypothetical protein
LNVQQLQDAVCRAWLRIDFLQHDASIDLHGIRRLNRSKLDRSHAMPHVADASILQAGAPGALAIREITRDQGAKLTKLGSRTRTRRAHAYACWESWVVAAESLLGRILLLAWFICVGPNTRYSTTVVGLFPGRLSPVCVCVASRPCRFYYSASVVRDPPPKAGSTEPLRHLVFRQETKFKASL